MSYYLDSAACLDSERAASLAANDEAMSIPLRLRVFGVSIKAGTSVRTAFEAMGFDSCTVTAQHADLLAEGEYLVVRALEAA